MSKNSQKAARADAETRALLAEQDARHAEIAAADRIERERMIRDFKNETAMARLEFLAAAAGTPMAAPEVTAPVTPPRDENTGRWLPAAPAAPEPVDPATMTQADYAAYREQAGIGRRGIEQTGRRGQALGDESGFPDWRDMSRNGRVFASTLPDNRRSVPVGYMRPSPGEDFR